MHGKDRISIWQRLALILFIPFLAPGCAPTRPTPVDIPSFDTVLQAEIDPAANLAWDNAEERLLVSGSKLRIMTLTSGQQRTVFSQPVEQMAWSPQGDRLVSTIFKPGDSAKEDETRVIVLSGDTGDVLDSRTVPGRVAGIIWPSANDILVASAALDVYSFGANFRFLLHRFAPRGPTSTTVLSDTTVKPATADYLGKRYERVFHVDLSPLDDEIIFTRFHDPPEAYPYLRLIVRHLDTGGGRVIDEMALSAIGAVWAGNAEDVYYDAGRRGIVRKRAWAKKGAEAVAEGESRAIDAAGGYLLVGNRLYREGQLVASLPEKAVYTLSPSGRYLAARRDSLLRVFSLPAAAGPLPEWGEEAMKMLLKLRGWRSRDLITPAEYQQRKQRISEP